VPKQRSLRRLVPDEALIERRAAGESLRQLADAYGVAHTTLLHYFRRTDVVLELREARKRVQVERRALKAQREQELRQERELRRRAREEAEHDRLVEAWKPPERAYRTAEIDWLDSKDDPRGSASFEGYSANDRKAAEVVAAGGGVDEVIEATGLRTRENVYRLDAQIISRALKNDARRGAAGGLDAEELRRLVPDTRLISRRAAGEPLRSLAIDYDVSHTTLSRYFRRPDVAKALRACARTAPSHQRLAAKPRQQEHGVGRGSDRTDELYAEIRRIRDDIRKSVCPAHGRRPSIRSIPGPAGIRFEVSACCDRASKDFVRRLSKVHGAVVWTT
jgi:hypothetical protein